MNPAFFCKWKFIDPVSFGKKKKKRLFFALLCGLSFWKLIYHGGMGFPGGSDGKESPVMQEIWFWTLGWEDALEENMATHSSILAWRIPWTEEPDGP